jgi:heat shock protein HslJ
MKGNVLVNLVFMVPIIVNACTTGASVKQEHSSFDTLQGKEWRLLAVKTPSGKHTGFSRQKLAADDMGDYYTLGFDTEMISGKAAPNRYRAPYHQEGNQGISFSAIAGTLMASFKDPEGLNEHEYYTYLAGVTRWNVVQGNLELYTKDENGLEAVLVFSTGD